jgi:hypothetical protein
MDCGAERERSEIVYVLCSRCLCVQFKTQNTMYKMTSLRQLRDVSYPTYSALHGNTNLT